ncbi:MAG TPA: hypothetical protein ENO22_01820, partial [candidate division Zixibacteria bacterium]|nr:hypothetical protein [candidate division Zixibacteria bacterium]
MKNLGGTTLLLLLVFLSSTAMGAEVVTDAAEYPPLQTVIISGSGYVPDESVTLQVTQEDGTPLTGEYGEPWIVVADESGNISSTWTAPYPDQPDDTVMLTGSGSTSGEEGATTFLIAPQNYIHQLQNGTATAVPNWAGGVINSNNSCYSEGRAVPYRYFVENLDGGSQHYITIECEWTKGGLHGFDYFADYDFSESSGISAAGGTCGSISASPPPDCQPISGSYPFPDPTNSANYSSPIPPDFFPTGFVLNAPTNLSFYNMTVDSVSKYYFAGTSSDRTFGITIYFTAVDTGSVGLYWGGHMAQGTPDTWGIGNGSGSIAGAPIHMRAGVLDGSGGFKEISAQTGVICLPPDATISCSADSVCTDTVYSCSAPAGADDYIWSLTGGTILSGQGTETITYTVTQPYPGFVYIDLEACDTTSGCPGDNCCSYDSVELPVGYCCDPPVATCPGDTTIFACDLSQICLPGFDCNGTATVTGGTLSGNSVCFTPVEGLNTITFICTNDCGFADTCVTNVTVELNQAPVCSLPGDTAIFQCVPTEVSLPVSGTDPDGNLTGCSVIAGPGSIVGGYWQYTPAGDETVNVTVRCTDDCGAYCEASFSATFDINEPPVCNLPSNNTYFVCDDSTFSFPVSGTDADGNLTGCTMTSGVGTFDGSTWTFTATLEGVYSATFECQDDCGAVCGGTVDITVDFNAPPVITCPADINVDCNGSTDPANIGFATATDDHDPNPSITYSDSQSGNVITRTWTTTDDCGVSNQCDQLITIEDTTPPTITCPDAVSVQCPVDVPPADINSVTVSDDCDTNPVVTHVGDVSDNSSCPETITRTYRATDASGNYVECTQIITIDDTIAPVITCPADITLDCSDPTDPSFT